MFRRFVRRPSHTTVVAYLGLFVALGGTAYAVNTIGSDDVIDDSLTSADIKNLTVGTNDLAIGSVFGSRIKDNGIFTNHVSPNSLTGNDIDEQTFTAPLVRAFVRVDPSTCTGLFTDETCAIERSKGVTSVKRIAQGTYCVTAPALDADNVSAAVSVDHRGTTPPAGNTSATVSSASIEAAICPSDATDFMVVTTRQPTMQVDANGSLNATAVGSAGFSQDTAFQLVMP